MQIIPRPEHPRPDFYREDWVNLNGEWEFHEDYSRSGRERRLCRADAALDSKITVPFCRESILSGLGHTDFCECVWYRRTVTLPEGWNDGSDRILLHIGACDYKTEVWVNGQSVCHHVGGYVPINADITKYLTAGENVITVCADDVIRTHNQAGGKQCPEYASHGCSYTRTTGIWQTVWLERVPASYIKNFKIYTDIHAGTVTLSVTAVASEGESVKASAYYGGNSAGSAEAVVSNGIANVTVKLSQVNLWEIGQGRLYDLQLVLGDDKVNSYFGMRSVEVKEGFLYINGKKIFQRLVLDQGFYPDGIYTASDDSELENDINRSIACGFHGARLHQKIFEPRFLWYCDKKGYIVWGEHGNWGLDIARADAWANFIPEWVECLERDFNHPAIIGWCPLNETQKNQDPDFVRALCAVTRVFDPTRAYIDTSGWTHVHHISDFYDVHDYDQNPVSFRARYEDMRENGTLLGMPRNHFGYTTTFVSEYGGIRWAPEGEGWGYGNAPATGEEFIERFRGLADALLDNPAIGGLCYTQLTDVEQEVNGLYTYDRRIKFDADIFKKILTKKAACED